MTYALTFTLTPKVDQGRPVVQLVEPITLQGYVIPAGFTTDFASIPLFLDWLFPIFGLSCRASVLHDALCDENVPRAIRSKAFLKQMLEDGVGKVQAYIQYWTVLYWPFSEKETLECLPSSPPTK